MVKFFFWVSSRDYFVLDPRPLRAVKITQLHPYRCGRVPTRLRAQDAKVKLFITPSTYFRPRFARGEVPAPIPAGPELSQKRPAASLNTDSFFLSIERVLAQEARGPSELQFQFLDTRARVVQEVCTGTKGEFELLTSMMP
jgi:hypothetical protein